MGAQRQLQFFKVQWWVRDGFWSCGSCPFLSIMKQPIKVFRKVLFYQVQYLFCRVQVHYLCYQVHYLCYGAFHILVC